MTTSTALRDSRAHPLAGRVMSGAEMIVQVLADEVAEAGRIRVNSLNPGGTRTAMRAAAYPGEDPATLPEASAQMGLYLYLMGPDSRGVNGRQFDAATWRFG